MLNSFPAADFMPKAVCKASSAAFADPPSAIVPPLRLPTVPADHFLPSRPNTAHVHHRKLGALSSRAASLSDRRAERTPSSDNSGWFILLRAPDLLLTPLPSSQQFSPLLLQQRNK
jgi:hypothetical protein